MLSFLIFSNCPSYNYPKDIPLLAAMNISSLSLKPFSVKHTEKYSEDDTCDVLGKRIL